MTDRVNVLLSSSGRRVALLEAFRHALRRLDLSGEVMAADMSTLAPTFHTADRSFGVPRCDDETFVPKLLEICRDHDVRLLVPTIDPELPVLAQQRDRFATVGTTVAVSDPDTVAIASDKIQTHAWLECHGFPTVGQTTAVEALADPGGWPLPLVVKPRWGSASYGVVTVRSRAELEVAAAGDEVVVQTVAPGTEHTIDVLVDRDGRVACTVPRRRLEIRAGEVSKGVTVRQAALEDLAARVCEALPGPFGALNVQVFLDEDDAEVRVIEINPRFGGGYPLSWSAGADFPRWLVEDVTGLPSTASSDDWREGLVMLRYDDAVFVDAGDVVIEDSTGPV